jgi:toxin ParE1/3/4
MQPLDVEFRPAALAELSAIFDYVLEISSSLKIARDFTLRIRERCERIGDAPHGGRPRDDLAPGLRTVPFERSAVIVYVIADGRVQITNIFYGGRDYEALYRRIDSDLN